MRLVHYLRVGVKYFVLYLLLPNYSEHDDNIERNCYHWLFMKKVKLTIRRYKEIERKISWGLHKIKYYYWANKLNVKGLPKNIPNGLSTEGIQ